jgi:hypothetical protein
MGRGLGPVQLAIITTLRRTPDRTPAQLAAQVYNCTPQEVTQNQLRAINKALAALAGYWIVESADYRSMEGERRWRIGHRAESSRKVKPLPPQKPTLVK